MAREIAETRCTCGSCGHVWHYGKQEATEARAAAMHNVGKSLMCCSGCLPAILIRDKELIDLDQCPQCGSRNVTTEKIIHRVDD